MSGIANVQSNLELGGGASFWVYISPQNNTDEVVKGWEVTFSQNGWSDSITSENPTKQIKTPGLSGIFNVKVTALNNSTHPASKVALKPQSPSTSQIGCNSNCASMVGIVAGNQPLLGGVNAEFWTTWDALCKMP